MDMGAVDTWIKHGYGANSTTGREANHRKNSEISHMTLVILFFLKGNVHTAILEIICNYFLFSIL